MPEARRSFGSETERRELRENLTLTLLRRIYAQGSLTLKEIIAAHVVKEGDELATLRVLLRDNVIYKGPSGYTITNRGIDAIGKLPKM